jgi:hypothetical protein
MSLPATGSESTSVINTKIVGLSRRARRSDVRPKKIGHGSDKESPRSNPGKLAVALKGAQAFLQLIQERNCFVAWLAVKHEV